MYFNGYYCPYPVVPMPIYQPVQYSDTNYSLQSQPGYNQLINNTQNDFLVIDPNKFKQENPNVNLLPCVEIEKKYLIHTPIGNIYGFYNNSANFLGTSQFFSHFIVDDNFKDDANEIASVYPLFVNELFEFNFLIEGNIIIKYGYIMRQIYKDTNTNTIIPFNTFLEINDLSKNNYPIKKFIVQNPILNKYVFLSSLYIGFIFNYCNNMVFLPIHNYGNLFYFEENYKKLVMDFSHNYISWDNIFKKFYNDVKSDKSLNVYKKNIKEYKFENNNIICDEVESPIMSISNTMAIKEYSDYLSSLTKKYVNFKEFIVGNIEWIFDLYLNNLELDNFVIIDNHLINLIEVINSKNDMNTNFLEITDTIKSSFVLKTDLLLHNKYIIRKITTLVNVVYQVFVNYDNKYLHNIIHLNVNLPNEFNFYKLNDTYLVNSMDYIFERCFNMIRISIFDLNSTCKLKDNILQLHHFNYIMTTFNSYFKNTESPLEYNLIKINDIMEKIRRLTYKLNYLKIYDLTSDEVVKEQFNLLEKNNELEKYKKTLELYVDYGIDCNIPVIGYIDDVDFQVSKLLTNYVLI